MEIWRKIRKRCFLLGVICLIGSSAAGCGNKLSDKFDEEEVKEAAETMINQVNSGELKDVYENTFAPVMRQGIEYEQLQENLDYVFDKLGEFESYEKISVVGGQDKDTETPYAVVVLLAKYEEGKAQYTVTFDTGMKCIGFYVK